MKLTPEERETIILFSDADKEASIYTFDRRLIRRLRTLSEKYPEQIRFQCGTSRGAQEYIVPKECIAVLSPWTKERRDAARRRALKNGVYPPKKGS